MVLCGFAPGGWRRAAAHALALAALLALVLAPLNLCCLAGHAAAQSLSLETALGPAAPVALCAHSEAKGDGSGDHAPGHAQHEECPCCQFFDGAALEPSREITIAVYEAPFVETLNAPETLKAIARPQSFAGRPRAPPHLI